ncbi:tRNA (adenosine(37)-N6)-dimethylallyltransferase MiaA [Marinospirillum alkaliphilum]|uniref:tRNA dimethylallyltransferase n=1 Tax=Marinospirillum alkaliphilum DSM 21637 TaxID=1122209 RepID=A0A1K1W1G7_9GAMM|nr:tRNA (adenosine(37)-N6)-dimethylallyltransferase MiaA [Marinospirillum alkaliphilum]SFX31264.1 tRNA dimethylallyltransferase [Marinospirillum alkaliphilum DSM 21637]
MTSDVIRPPAIFLLGPTASGKTDLAVALVEQLNCEIISVDSALVYRGMDIGAAKPDAATLARAPHRLIDIRDPAESYSAGDFRRDALQAMQDITAAGRVPLLVGGTSLYYQRLLAGDSNLPEADPQIRAVLEAELQQLGCPALHQRLAAIDPESAARIAPTDPQRTLRALELWQLTGKTRSQLWREQQPQAFGWRLLQLGLTPAERSTLHQRIAKRFANMLEQGFIEEVKALRARGDLHLGLPSMRAVGYRQVWQYLDGEFDYSTLLEKGIAATRQLAKRQLTWMRSWEKLHWLQSDHPELLPLTLAGCRAFMSGDPVDECLLPLRLAQG